MCMYLIVGRNIRRIVFYSMEKYSDGEVGVLSPVDAKQIAGRAGRYLSPYPYGEVTTYVCVCVCVCVCVRVHACVCVHTFMHACVIGDL